MRTTTHRFNRPVWFKKWNRKAYSVFRSLGVVVHISKLSASVADQSLLKTSSARLEEAHQSPTDTDARSESSDPLEERLQTAALRGEIRFTTLAVQTSCPQAAKRAIYLFFFGLNSLYRRAVSCSALYSAKAETALSLFIQVSIVTIKHKRYDS